MDTAISHFLSLSDIYAARQRIAAIADNMPLVPSPFLSQQTGGEVLLQLETMQASGAFKLRGAVNAVFGLPEDTNGVTCCSTGNHGRAVAFAAAWRGLRAVICMSELVPQTKIDGIRALGAEARIAGRSQDEAQIEAQRLVDEEGLTDIPPFDDTAVIAGQGTIALDIIERRPDVAAILIPLSGGGLAAGVAMAAKTINPAIQTIGISMDRGAAMHVSIKAGAPVEVEEVASLADSLGGGIGLNNRHSFALCRKYLDRTLLVSEEEIYRAMQAHYYEDRLIVEGAGAVGAAAVLSDRLDLPEGPIVSLLTGRNVDMAAFTAIVNGDDVALGDMTIMGNAYGG